MTPEQIARDLTHFDAAGNAVMVDVIDKPITRRRAEAHCEVRGIDDFGEVLREGANTDVLSVARVAGVFGAKRTSHLIPLCHQLPLSSVEISFVIAHNSLEIIAAVETDSQTGVEMEALAACGVAALTVVSELSMRGAQLSIEGLELLEKRGGRSGHWVRDTSETTTSSR